jgi:hypothetical protein
VAIVDAATQANHYVEPGHVSLTGTKYFPQYAFHAVAVYRQSLNFTRDHQSQSGVRKIIGFSEDLEKFAACRTPESDN